MHHATDDDYSMGDVFNERRAMAQQKRAANRETSPELLRAAGIAFEERNGGAHLIVAGGAWDFWPGTGLYHERGGKKRRGRGVRNLINIITKAA